MDVSSSVRGAPCFQSEAVKLNTQIGQNSEEANHFYFTDTLCRYRLKGKRRTYAFKIQGYGYVVDGL